MRISHGSPGYLDLEANRKMIFSKKTDIFSTACVIFEMDKKAHLLFYPHQKQTRGLYVDALTKGRARNLPHFTFPDDSMERQDIMERAMESQFYCLLIKMLAPSTTRLTAAECLIDPTLLLLMRKYEYMPGRISQCKLESSLLFFVVCVIID